MPVEVGPEGQLAQVGLRPPDQLQSLTLVVLEASPPESVSASVPSAGEVIPIGVPFIIFVVVAILTSTGEAVKKIEIRKYFYFFLYFCILLVLLGGIQGQSLGRID